MSLHAQLSPEALKRLHAQQRNSTVTSIIISVLVILLIGIILLLILLPPIDNSTPDIVTYNPPKQETTEEQTPKTTRNVKRKPTKPKALSNVIVSVSRSNIAVPMPDIDVADPTVEFGVGEDTDFTPSAGFGDIQPILRKRCSLKDRLDRLNNNGGNKKCEDAVVKSLRWLKKTQKPDGSWGAMGNRSQQIAATSFAVLAYLGHCETPNSQEFGDSVLRGITYLVNISMKNNGKIAGDFKGHWAYEHGIATYALGESATFCNKLNIPIPNLNDATKKAGDWILKNQHQNGSWAYHFEKKGGKPDNSVGLWQIQALKACKHSGLWDIDDFRTPMRKALTYIQKTQNRSGAIGYNSANAHVGNIGWTMTGGGMLAYQMWGKSSSNLVSRGSRFILKHDKFKYNTPDADLYRQYYHAQAMINRGGEEWKKYNANFRDEILNNQNPDGTWKNVGGGKNVLAVGALYQGTSAWAVHYRTCLCTFMLEVYYRFLPATGSGH